MTVNGLPRSRLSRHGQLLIASLTLGAVATVAVMGWYYLRQKATIETAGVQQVIAVAQSKVKQLVNWRRERLGDGQMLTVPGIQRLAKCVFSDRSGCPSGRAELLEVLQNMERQYLYTGAALVDRNGQIRLQCNIGPSDPLRIAELGRAAAQSRDVNLKDLYLDPKLQRPLMAESVPVQGSGAFILTIDPERFLFPFMKDWPVPSATGETLLVRRDGDKVLYLSDFRHRTGTAMHTSRPVAGIQLRQIKTLSGWVFDQPDHRGQRALGIVLPVPDSPWYVIAKINASELDAPVSRLGCEMLLIVALIIAANMAGVGFIWRDQQIRLYRQRRAWLRQMEDETPAFLWTTAEDSTGLFINKPLAEFIGGSQNQKLRGSWRTYLHPDDVERVSENFYNCVAKGIEFVDEHRLRRFDGEYRWFISKGMRRSSDYGSSHHYSGSLFDITERKIAENEIAALTARLINAQEEERTRLARELHDDLGQQIAALSIGIGNLKRGIPSEFGEARAKTEYIREKLVHLANCTRRLSHELHPAVLQHCGLEIALRAFCSEFGALAGIQVTFQSDGSFNGLPPTVAVCAFRVAQEALQNVAKHAHTAEAAVALRQIGQTVTLTISDRGVGMDLNKAGAGLGLISIRERARLVNGTVDIQTCLNRGTALTVTLPLQPDGSTLNDIASVNAQGDL